MDNTPDALKKYDYYDVVGDFYRVHSYDEDYNELTGLLDPPPRPLKEPYPLSFWATANRPPPRVHT